MKTKQRSGCGKDRLGKAEAFPNLWITLRVTHFPTSHHQIKDYLNLNVRKILDTTLQPALTKLEYSLNSLRILTLGGNVFV